MAAFILLASSLAVGQVDASVLSTNYPRITREWSDTSGKFSVRAKLINVPSGAVVLEKADGKTVKVPLAKLDKTSREIAEDAYPFFLVEAQARDLLHAAATDPATATPNPVKRREILAQMAKNASRPLRSQRLKLRYLITHVGPLRKPRATTSKIGEYEIEWTLLATYRPTPDSWRSIGQGPRITNGLGNVYRAEAFDPTGLVENRSIVEYSGVPLLVFEAERSSRIAWLDTGWHEKDPKQAVPLLLHLALEDEQMRIFTPTLLEGWTSEERAVHGEATAQKEPMPGAPKTSGEAPMASAVAPAPVGAGAPTEARQPKFRPIIIAGTGRKETLECRGEDVSISGFKHEIILTGPCATLTVTGMGNRVTAEEVAAITVSGAEHVVRYARGPGGKPPTIQNLGKNEVEQIAASEKLPPDPASANER